MSDSVDPIDPDAMAQRITELEVKAAFTEDLLDTLNDTVAKQQLQIEALLREVLELRRQAPGEGPAFTSLRDEIPPHY
jgi:SlyX protein